MSQIERERKFLVKPHDTSYRRLAFQSDRIEQGYIARQGGRTVRVRIRERKGFLTIKGPSVDGGLSRYEFETEVSLKEAQELMLLCQGGTIQKRRYLVHSGRHTVEVDEFYGDNEGLVVAEIELGSADEPYVKPDFLDQEVTGDVRYYNSSLLVSPYRSWASKE